MLQRNYKNEKDVKREIKRLLERHKWFWFNPPANGYGRTGISDTLALRAGVFMAVEAKFGKNRATEPQKGFLQSIQTERGFAFLVDDQNIDSFGAFLVGFDAAVALVSEKGKSARPEPEEGAIMLNAIQKLTRGYA